MAITQLTLSSQAATAWDFSGYTVTSIASSGYSTGKLTTSDSAGNLILAGEYTGTKDFDPGAGVFSLTSSANNEGYVAKFDSTGNFLWVKTFRGDNSTAFRGITTDSSNNIYLTGLYYGSIDMNPGAAVDTRTAAGSSDAVILKLNSSGDLQWVKTYGSSGSDGGLSLAINSSGDVIATGYFLYTTNFDSGNTNTSLSTTAQTVSIMKLTSSGDFQWVKGFSLGVSGSSVAYSIKIDSAGDLVLIGTFTGTVDFDPSASASSLTANSTDIFITKLSSLGVFVWVKQIGNSTGERATEIAIDSSQNLFVTGYFQGVTDFDPGAGTSNLTSSTNVDDAFVLKLDSSGNFLWAKALIGDSNASTGWSIAVDSAGEPVIGGYFKGSKDFDPGAGTQTISVGSNYENGFVWKLSASGEFRWARSFGGASTSDYIWSVSIVGGNKVLVAGTIRGATNFATDGGSAVKTPNSNGDGYLLKLTSSGSSVLTLDPVTVSLALAGGATTAIKGQIMTLTVQIEQPGVVTFYADGKKIPRCISISAPSTSVTCNWKPAVRKAYVLTVKLVPSSPAYAITITTLNTSASSRTGNR